MAESSEGEEEGKVTVGNQVLMVEDDLREMGKNAAWSVNSWKSGNGVSFLRDDNLDTYWQSLLPLSLLLHPTTIDFDSNQLLSWSADPTVLSLIRSTFSSRRKSSSK